MALTKPRPKRKKNSFRLSSDRQPEIEKANERKRSRRFGRPPGAFEPPSPKRMNPLGPRKTLPPRLMPKKGIEEFLKKLEEQQKNSPRLKITPAVREKLKRLKEQLKRNS